MRRLFIPFLFLLSSFGAYSEAQTPASVSDTDAWVTVIFRITSNGLTVEKVYNGTSKKVFKKSGDYLEGYLPKSLFPGDTQISPLRVKELLKSPKNAASLFINGYKGNSCGPKADIVVDWANNKIPMFDPSTQSTVTVNFNSLTKNTSVEAVIRDGQDNAHVKNNVPPPSCPLPQSKLLTPKAAVVGDTLDAMKNSGNSCSVENEKLMQRAALQVDLRSQLDSLPTTKSTSCCKSYVTRALYYSGLTPMPIRTQNARDTGSELKQQGFVNIMKRGVVTKESEAPAGAILVYSGGEYGHVAIKTTKPAVGYISDFFAVKPPSDRKLIGIYIKKECEN